MQIVHKYIDGDYFFAFAKLFDFKVEYDRGEYREVFDEGCYYGNADVRIEAVDGMGTAFVQTVMKPTDLVPTTTAYAEFVLRVKDNEDIVKEIMSGTIDEIDFGIVVDEAEWSDLETEKPLRHIKKIDKIVAIWLR